MAKNLKTKTVLVVDYGNYIGFAIALAKTFGTVYYYTPWQTSYPKWNQYAIGIGVEEIERIDEPWSRWDEYDLIAFPDLFQGDFADWCVKQGKVVFGAKQGEEIEIYRNSFKELLKDFKLDVNKYEEIEGMTALREYLEGKEDKYIKTNLIRGSLETFHYKDDKLSASRLKQLHHELGAYAEHAIFIVEDPIPDAVEIGYDGWTIDGKYPEVCLTGVETKDCGYCGGIIDYDKLPDSLQKINKKFAKVFAESQYRCNFSNEVRITKDGKAYFIDPTCRIPQPPGDLMQILFTNFGEMVWDIANGIVPTPEYKHKFGAQLIIKSSWAEQEPQAVYFDEKYKDFVHIKNLMVTDGIRYYIPIIEMQEIGAITGYGDTIEEAIDMVKKIAETVKGDCIELNPDGMMASLDQIEKLKEYGIKLF